MNAYGKLFLLFLLVNFSLIESKVEEFEEKTELVKININLLVDSVLTSTMFIEKQFEPLPLPPFNKTINTIFVPGKVKVALFNGYLQGIHTLHRSGKSQVETKRLRMDIAVPSAIKEIEFGYDFNIKTLLKRHTGSITGSVEGFELFLNGTVSPRIRKIRFNDIEITDQGKLSIKLKGSFSDIILNQIIKAVEGPVYSTVIAVINKTLEKFLNRKLLDFPVENETYL